MTHLMLWSDWLQVRSNPIRFRLLFATFAIAGLSGYISLKLPLEKSLHSMAWLYAQGDLSILKTVQSWRLASFPVFLMSAELGIDTLLFIPIYSCTLLIWSGYYAQNKPITDRSYWLTKALSWLAPVLPLLVLITVVADLIENSCLGYWLISGSIPVSPFVMQSLWWLKMGPVAVVAGYILLGFLMSRPVGAFMKEILQKIWFIFKILTLNKYVRCGVAMLRTVWPLCIVLIITYLFLNLMDQVRDLLYALVNDPKYSACLLACLLLYAVVVWYSTRIIFILKDQRHIVERVNTTDEDSDQLNELLSAKKKGDRWLQRVPEYTAIDLQTLRVFTRWTPVVLGLVPFLAFMSALSKVEETTLLRLVVVVEMLVYLAIAYQVKNYVEEIRADDTNIRPHAVRDLRPVHRRNLHIALASGILLVILASLWVTNLAISRFFGPVAIVILALTMWAMIASFFTYLDYRYKAPFTVVCFLIMMFMNNNNHQIRTISTTSGSYFSKDTATHTIPAYFSTWLDSLTDYRTKQGYAYGPIPVYLVSTEGGGIRSAYWTASVLQQLDSAQRDFFRHTFAISGVSGGSVGASVFTAQYRDKLINERQKKSFTFDIDTFFKRDYLSPLLTAMLIPDMLQKFSPASVNLVDRAQYLENGWSDAYVDYDVQTVRRRQTRTSQPDSLITISPDSNRKTLDESFIDLWGDSGTRYQIPVLFLNATQAETGRKSIMTPLVIRNDQQFDNVVDIQEEVYRHIALKTAASMSARFPIVTPPATIGVVNDPSTDASNFVDGGYIDNSGTTTLLSILSSISSNQPLRDTLRARGVVFHIISINNSVETNPNQQVKALTGLYELKAPLLAFFESWDNSGDYRRYAVKEYAHGFSGLGTTLPKYNLYSFDLNRKTGVIPLGWDLSKQAEGRIQEQSRRLYLSLKDEKQYPSLFKDFTKSPPFK